MFFLIYAQLERWRTSLSRANRNRLSAQEIQGLFGELQFLEILIDGNKKNLFSPMETGILQVASQIPAKIPSEKQSVILIDVLAKAALEGVG